MALFLSADGADSAAVGPAFSGDRPSNDPSRPLGLSLLLLPAYAEPAKVETVRSQGKLQNYEQQDRPPS